MCDVVKHNSMNAVLLQVPFMVGLLLFLCFFVAPLCWVVSGVALLVNSFAHDTCDMMRFHVAGMPNQWVLERMQCDKLKSAYDAASDLMAASNEQTADVNKALDRAPCFLQQGP